MGKNQSASNLPNIIQYSNGSINFVSGSTLLMQISSSGAITTTGVISGSNALSSSYAVNSDQLDGFDSTAFVFTSSFNTYSSSMSTRTSNNESTGSTLTTASASFAVVSSSYSTASGSLSTRVTKIEGNYATTGSNVFLGAQTVCANITSTGTIIAQTLNVQQVTSSIVYSSGSNVFGNLSTDVQQMTGSLRVTGSLSVTGTSCYAGCLNVLTGNQIRLYNSAKDNWVQIESPLVGGDAAIDFKLSTATGVVYMNNTGITCFNNTVCTPTGLVSGDITLNSGKSLKFASNVNSYIAEEYGIRLNLGGTTTQYGTQFYNSSGTKVAMIDATGGACFSGLQICSSADPSFYFYRSTCNAGSGLGRIYWNGLDSTSTQRTYAYVQSVIEACSSTALCSRLEFILASNNNIARIFQINGAGTACFSGSVCAPAIVGGVVCGTSATFSSNITGPNFYIPVASAGTYGISDLTAAIQTYGGIAPTCTILFYTCGAERMRIACNGNVGIGTATPCGIFHTQATNSGIYFDLSTAYTPKIIAAGSISDIQIQSVGNGGNIYLNAPGTTSAIEFSTNGTQSTGRRMVITSGGNVGINNTTPCGKLQISLGTVANGCFRNSSGGEAALTIEACGNSYLQFMNCSTSQTGIMFGNTCLQYSGMIWYRHDAKQLMLGAGGTETMYICGGRVGVGTSTPTAGFHSVGSSKYENSTYYGFAQSYVWQSVFNNPPQLLYQFTSGNTYAQTLIKVTFIQNGVSNGFAGWFVGYALAHRNPTTLYTAAYTMTAQHNPSNITAPTLSWTDCALCITPNRATNYDGYIVYVEWGGNTNNNATPCIAV